MKRNAICIVLMFAILLVPACGSSSPAQVLFGTAAALATVALLANQSPIQFESVFLSTLIVAVIGIAVIHTVLSVPSQIPALLYTEISAFGLITLFLTTVLLINLFGSAQVQGPPTEPVFPEGQGPNGFTVYANMPLQMAEGDYHVVHMSVEEEIPITDDDPTRVYQYGFVFDADGNPDNNYSQPNNDFFNDTDKWYVMSYTDADGWVLTVSTAIDGNVMEVASAAKVIIRDNAMTLVVPAAEFGVSDPDYRVTAFCHTGDFGIPEPHNWSGDLHPPEADGLQDFPDQGS